MTSGIAGRALAMTAHLFTCPDCGQEPRVVDVDGRPSLRCIWHPAAALAPFVGGKRATPPREVPVESATTPGLFYRVTIGLDGTGICTCRGYESAGHCEHARKGEEVWMTNVDAQPVTALVPIKVLAHPPLLPSESELAIIKTLSSTAMLAKSMLPASIKTQADAAAVMLSGLELGVRPFTALRHIFIVNGKPEPDAQIMAGIVNAKEADSAIEIVELDDSHCTMRIRRPGKGINAEFTYYLEDARKAGLISAANPWGKYPKDMMRWAATKRLCRAYAPDLINAVDSFDTRESAAMMESVEDHGPVVIDVQSLPASELYSDGDDPTEETPTAAEGEFRDATDDEAASEVASHTSDAPPPPPPAEAAPTAPGDVMQRIVSAFTAANRMPPKAASVLAALGLERIADLPIKITVADAIEICFAVWDYDQTLPMPVAASRVHAMRAMEGKPFIVGALLPEEVAAVEAFADASGDPGPDAPPEPPPAPAGKQLPPPPRRPRDATEKR